MKRTRSIFATAMTLGLALALQSGCASTAKVAETPVATPPAAPPEQLVEVLSGKVVETTKGSGYLYLLLEKDGVKTWAAISGEYEAKVGEEVTLKPGMVMTNFKSAALDRTFDRIIFSDGRADAPAAKKEKKQMKKAETMSNDLSGKVLETMDAGGYTYVNLERDGNQVWVALPVTKVNVGDELTPLPGMRMDKFTSKSLNRTFDVIYFSSGVAGNGAAPAPAESVLPPGHPK